MSGRSNVIYAVIVRRRWVRWHVEVPGVGDAIVSSRTLVESAARQLIEAETGHTDVQVVVLSQPAGPRARGTSHVDKRIDHRVIRWTPQ